MLRKRRIWPLSSRRCGRSSGNFSSSTTNSSSRFDAAQATEATPAVCRRNAVGICTVIAILCSNSGRFFGSSEHAGDFLDVQSLLQVVFEFLQLGRDRLLNFVHAREHIGGFQSIAGDAEHGRLFRKNAVLTIQLACGSDRYAARGLSENAFGL